MKNWIQAARLRTLPLSVSGILIGGAYAAHQHQFDKLIFVLSVMTTLGLQILSNFANDYGDGIKGTDNKNRIGPKRAIQSGSISITAMKKGIILTALVTLLLAFWLIYVSFGHDNFGYSLLFLLLGIASIVAALKYTIGKSAYGYRGLGDIYVFLFFGLLSVLGSNFLYSKVLDPWLILPACAIGLLSTGVLNLNNMRDENSDRVAHKMTLVVKMGGANARIYHYLLCISALALLATFMSGLEISSYRYLFLLSFIPIGLHLKRIAQYQNPSDYDPELKQLALGTFLIALVLGLVLAL